jgi:hypothetical protein
MNSCNGSEETGNDGSVNDTNSESSYDDMQGETLETQLERELLVSGLIHPAVGGEDGIEIHRGMKILTTEGEVAGMVAGVIHNRTPHKAEYILLSRPSQQLEYRMVPVELIQQVSRETVLLHIAAPVISTLLRWHN